MYVSTENLLAFAEEKGTIWRQMNLPPGTWGIYCETYNLIGINKILREGTSSWREIFSEELGHGETLGSNQYSTDPTYLGRILDNKIERPALIWAVNFLIDTYEYLSLCAQLSDCSAEGMIYQLAEYFGVTPRFIKLKERIIREKGYLLNWDIGNGNCPCWLREQSYRRTGRRTLSCL